MRHSTKIISLLAFITIYVSAQTCSQYGSASDSTCLCPPGFNPSSGSTDCTLPVCGGSLYQPGPAAPGGTGGFGNVTLDSTCGCSSGWAGPGCTVCNSASACTNSLTRFLNSSNSLSTGLNNTMTCSNIPTAFASSEMSCNVVTPLLQSLFPLRSTLTITRTLNASLSPGGSNALTSSRLVGGDGVVYAQLWYEGVEQFYCRAGSCTQTVASSGGGSVNGSTWVCPDLACTCRPNTDFCGRTPAVSKVMASLIQTIERFTDHYCPADQPHWGDQRASRPAHDRLLWNRHRNMWFQLSLPAKSLRSQWNPIVQLPIWRMRSTIPGGPSTRHHHGIGQQRFWT
jgi:hypothetical protein